MTLKTMKRISFRDKALVKLFLLVVWPLIAIFLFLSYALVFLVVFFSIPFCRVFEKDGKLSIELPWGQGGSKSQEGSTN
jgi:hypothetical protein